MALVRGDHCQHLPDDVLVIRLYRAPYNEMGSPDAFNASSADKAEAKPSISVWAEELTTPSQARAFMSNPGGIEMYGRASVRTVRKLSREGAVLEVEWRHLSSDLPGYEGHCGMTGAIEIKDKMLRKSVRSDLVQAFQWLRVEEVAVAAKEEMKTETEITD